MKDRLIAAIVLGVLSTVFAFTIGLSVKQGYKRSQCITYGYPDSDVYLFDVYCIRLVNNTQEVVNIIDLQK